MRVKNVFVALVAALAIGSLTYTSIINQDVQPVSASYNDKTSV